MASIQNHQQRIFANPTRTSSGDNQLQGEKPSRINGTYVATAYGPPWNSMEGSGVTAGGTRLSPTVMNGKFNGPFVIAADPSVIPMGTLVYIWPNPFDYQGPFRMDDTGGAIKGRRIDFYDPYGREHQNNWGRRTVNISVSRNSPRMPGPEDLGEGGPIPFGGLDTGKSPSDVLSALLSKIGGIFSPATWWMIAKVIFGGALLLLALARISGAI